MIIARRRWALFMFLQEYGANVLVSLMLLFLIMLGAYVSPVFFTWRNFNNLLLQAIALAFVSIGQTFVILTDGIDLSVGSTVSLIMCLTTGMILGRESYVLPVIITTFMVAIAIGFCNGFIHTKTKISPLIVTLGMMTFLKGCVLLYTTGPYGEMPPFFSFVAWGKIGPLPFPVFLLLVAVLGAGLVLTKTTFGRYVYATGGNEEIARRAGIKTNKIKITCYIISSFTAFLTGLFLSSRMGMGDPLIGDRYMLDSIIPVLIGGTSLSGGKGGVLGTVLGVFILIIVANLLNLLGVSGWWNWTVEGAIIIIAVSFYRKKD
jgi:ribose transport system permease protein